MDGKLWNKQTTNEEHYIDHNCETSSNTGHIKCGKDKGDSKWADTHHHLLKGGAWNLDKSNVNNNYWKNNRS